LGGGGGSAEPTSDGAGLVRESLEIAIELF
jgi:hypothetical protein